MWLTKVFLIHLTISLFSYVQPQNLIPTAIFFPRVYQNENESQQHNILRIFDEMIQREIDNLNRIKKQNQQKEKSKNLLEDVTEETNPKNQVVDLQSSQTQYAKIRTNVNQNFNPQLPQNNFGQSQQPSQNNFGQNQQPSQNNFGQNQQPSQDDFRQKQQSPNNFQENQQSPLNQLNQQSPFNQLNKPAKNTLELNSGPTPLGEYFENPRPQFSQNHRFDVTLLGAVMSQNSKNVMISPLGLTQVLSLIIEAANGPTKQQLLNSLHSTYIGQNHSRQRTRQLLTQLKNSVGNSVSLNIANRVYLSNRELVNEDYINALSRYYDTGVELLNFSDQLGSSRTINSWVTQATNGFLSDIAKPENIPTDTAAVILNALYFKGLWERTFDKSRSESRCFNHRHKDCHSYAWLMAATGKYNFAVDEDLDAKVLEIPYKDNKFSMLIFLPNRADGLQQLIELLPTEYDRALKKMVKQEVIAGIPRFTFESEQDLKEILKLFGINQVFNKIYANLRNLVNSKEQFYISDILQKTKIEVNEEGTKAAAVTQSNVISLAGMTKPRFIADHPFVFFIRHVDTGTILFAGRVTEPTPAPEPQITQNQPRNARNQHTGRTRY